MQKQQDIQTKLRDYLRESGLRSGERLPGERDLAFALGVGRTALRSALDALEEAGVLERRPQSGTFLTVMPPPAAQGQSAVLIAPFGGTGEADRHHDAEWLYRVAAAFERIAIPAGLHVLTKDQSPRIQEACSIKDMALEAAQSGISAVVLLHPVGTRAKIAHALALLHDRGVHPLIVSSRTYPGMASQVYFDSGWGAYLATQYLLRKAHRRIGFAGAPGGHEWVRDRLSSYRSALEAAEVIARNEWIWLAGEGERLASADDGASAFHAWQRVPETIRPTAIVAANDVVALGVLQAAREAGVAVPDALSLVGFDNDPEAMLAGLTTVERPTDTLGETAARVVLERLAAGFEAETVSVRLRPILIERRTVAAPKA
jgi:DNA-binding LacI/PurR family transcriptional regulator